MRQVIYIVLSNKNEFFKLIYCYVNKKFQVKGKQVEIIFKYIFTDQQIGTNVGRL
jgi:hypothetical protein